MSSNLLSASRARHFLAEAARTRLGVVGDVMLDQFIWGSVSRISPEAPVPVLDFERESVMPGGAANVARNLTSLKVPCDLFGVVGQDIAGRQLKGLLDEYGIGCRGVLADARRATSVKTRIVAHKQQVVRIDRETRRASSRRRAGRLPRSGHAYSEVAAVIVGDYGKGVVTQELLDEVKDFATTTGSGLAWTPSRSTTWI